MTDENLGAQIPGEIAEAIGQVDKAIYLDCFAGISGNMMLGALIQAGVPEEKLREALAGLSVKGYEIDVKLVEKCGVSAVYVNVVVTEDQPHRHLSDILAIIENSRLSSQVKKMSKLIFKELAAAEAKVHGVGLEEVHFHEVGAVDAIVDVVGAVWALDYLGIKNVYVSKLHVGGGFVECCHGTIPVPAPATAELLNGIPYYQKDILKELVTPTGAAIVKTLGTSYGDRPDNFISRETAYGAGTWDLDIPNVLRVQVGEIISKRHQPNAHRAEVTVIETNIDDLNPQIYPCVLEKLLSNGALDAWITPIIMKKGRPAVKLSVMFRDDGNNNSGILKKLAQIIFSETSAIGLRFYRTERIEAKREILTVETPWGPVKVKVSFYPDKICNIAPEFEDCRQVALEAGVSLKVVQQVAVKEAMNIC